MGVPISLQGPVHARANVRARRMYWPCQRFLASGGEESNAKITMFFVSSKEPAAVLEHICEVRGVAADFAGTILAVGAQTLLWFGHGCSGNRMLSKHERYYGLGMDALVTVCFGTRTLLWFGHGCSGNRMLSKHERYYGLGMDALVTVCSWNTNVILVWAWMLW